MFAIGIGATYVDPETERDPPPPPTVVTFPQDESYPTVVWTGLDTAPRFAAIFGSIAKPRDITRDHVEALNIEYVTDKPLEELLPPASDGSSVLPAVTADQACEITEYSDPRISSAEQQRRRQEFHSRLAELRIDNDTAYRTLARIPKDGTRGARLAHMRKFYEGLESMSRYWECDKDEYYTILPKDDEPGNERRVKRIRSENHTGSQSETYAHPDTEEVHSSEVLARRKIASEEEGYGIRSTTSSPAATCGSSRSGTASPEPQVRTRYQGRRTSTGSDMPDTFRSDTVKSFVEGIVWPFRCSVHPPRVLPFAQFGGELNVPVRQTAAVYRQAEDRARARQGHLEGPLFTVQARAETNFHADIDELAMRSRLDLLRELGALIQIAQERRREGRTEVKPGEAKWWTTKRRFGGSTHALIKGADEKTKTRVPNSAWEQLRCGTGYWDPKTLYMAIGKNPASCFDEIFMVSSLNHHISILKLTVHVSYTDYLSSGNFPELLPGDLAWSQPRLQRSLWFDMFNVEQRVEAFRGIWGMMAYLTRSMEAPLQPQEAM